MKIFGGTVVFPNNIQRASVIGAGVMGTGLAITIASNGIVVSLNDVTEELLSKSWSQISDLLSDLENRGLIKNKETIKRNIITEPKLDETVKDADIVFEAITENPIAKRDLFAKIVDSVKEDAILTSNTSVIKIGEIASGLKHNDRIVGVHWMNPPYVAPLVELTPSEWTDSKVVELVRDFLENKIGKKVVIGPDIPGFIVNRFHAVVASEAIRLIDEGVSVEDVDNVWKYHLGLLYTAFGPLMNADYIGLDTTYLAGLYLSQKLERNIVYVPDWFIQKINNKELGVKTQKGFYDYGDEKPSSLYAKRIQILRDELECRRAQK